jgi:hypothetical protein
MVTKQDTLPPAEEVINAVKLVGEMGVLPGSSLLIDGKIVAGGVHGILGYVAVPLLGRLLGPVGWILLAANSYSKSASGSYLHEHILGLLSEAREVLPTSAKPNK